MNTSSHRHFVNFYIAGSTGYNSGKTFGPKMKLIRFKWRRNVVFGFCMEKLLKISLNFLIMLWTIARKFVRGLSTAMTDSSA